MSEQHQVPEKQRPNGHAEERVVLADSFFDTSEEEARRSSRTIGEAAGGIGGGHPGTTQPLYPAPPEQGSAAEGGNGEGSEALAPIRDTEEVPFVPRIPSVFVALLLLGFLFGAIALVSAFWVMSNSTSQSDTKAIARKVAAEEIKPMEDKLRAVEHQSKGTLDGLNGLEKRVSGVERKPDLAPRIVKIERVDSSQSAKISRLRRELRELQDAYKSGQMETYPAVPGNRVDTPK